MFMIENRISIPEQEHSLIIADKVELQEVVVEVLDEKSPSPKAD
jgi:hypothetical protein